MCSCSAEVQLSRLDPRAPLVVDTRDLGRRAGSMLKAATTVPAPPDLGLDVIGVPEGSDLALELRLESVVEGVLVTGTATVQLQGECVRCLDPVTSERVVDIQELFFYADQAPEDDEDALRLEGELLDLEPVLRDAVVLGLPFQPLCRDDCPGLCSECGARLADDPDHGHDQVDPRWGALHELGTTSTPTLSTSGRPDVEEES
jgi:uncharacterized protein